jgi:hypothetical protein
MCADRETFAEPPLGGVWEVRVADGGELVDGGHRHTMSQSFVERFHIDCYKGRHLFYVGERQNAHVVCLLTTTC